MSENGSPSVGEVGRRVDELSRRVGVIDGKVDHYGIMVVGLGPRLDAMDRRMGDIERIMETGATRRSSATWQGLFLVLGVLGSVVTGIILSALVTK